MKPDRPGLRNPKALGRPLIHRQNAAVRHRRHERRKRTDVEKMLEPGLAVAKELLRGPARLARFLQTGMKAAGRSQSCSHDRDNQQREGCFRGIEKGLTIDHSDPHRKRHNQDAENGQAFLVGHHGTIKQRCGDRLD